MIGSPEKFWFTMNAAIQMVLKDSKKVHPIPIRRERERRKKVQIIFEKMYG